MHIFYVSNIGELSMDKEESHHCTKVLRLKTGAQIVLIDGKGTFATAVIEVVSDKKTLYKILDVKENFNQLTYDLHIAIAPTKNINRLEWFLEKATEIGISEITPILCENSERKVIKPERLQKIIVSACKQSQKAVFPKLNDLISYNDFIKAHKKNIGEKYIAHCYNNDMKTLKYIQGKKNVLIAIGPEGDFSPKEINLALETGFSPLTLGKSRLRTETAAVHCCSVLNVLNEIN